jgi:hypothetical protein
MWWNWQTVRTPIDTDNPDEEYAPCCNITGRSSPQSKGIEVDIYLELVRHYEEGEEPQGLYLSAETVSLQSQIVAALDTDVVVTAAENP